MLIPHHLECNLCGARSVSVQDRFQLSPLERQALQEFVTEHLQCAAAVEGWLPEHAVDARPDGWVCPNQGGPFGSAKPEPRSARRPHGYFEYTGPYGEIQSGDTLSCCHCRHHWQVRAGSEKERGFCALCYNGKPGSGYTCGKPECNIHIPFEVRIDNLAAGRALLTPPAPKAAVPELPAGFGDAVLLETSPLTSTAEIVLGPAEA